MNFERAAAEAAFLLRAKAPQTERWRPQLLTGARPHRVDDLRLAAVIRTVAEHDALPRHSLFRTMDADTRQKTAAARDADESSLAQILARDLGWIARKATAREREERYGSVADLAADLTRFLDD